MAPTIIANRHLIEAAPPGPRRYGLFDAATVVDSLDPRYVAAGVQFPELDCGPALDEYDANCGTHPTKEFTEGLGYFGGDPYWLYAQQRCGTVGRTPAEVADGVRRILTGGEQTAVENVVWTGGANGTSPALTTSTGVVTVTPAAPGATAALAALEASFYASYGYVGTVHVNTAAYAALTDVVDRSGGAGVLTTELGSRMAYGAGYGTTGPLGTAPDAGFVWAFMTPPVTVRRGDVIQPDVIATMDRATNQYFALAERVYLHTWACDTVHAVQIPVAAPQAAVPPAVPAPAPAGLVTETVEETV
jgi:hypothetical protein